MDIFEILLSASFWAAAIRIASPLIFATMGELICERAGVLNLGIEGIEVHARAKPYGQTLCYGAIGVGGTKMKIHKAAIKSLFTANDRVLDADAIFAIGKSLAQAN